MTLLLARLGGGQNEVEIQCFFEKKKNTPKPDLRNMARPSQQHPIAFGLTGEKFGEDSGSELDLCGSLKLGSLTPNAQT